MVPPPDPEHVFQCHSLICPVTCLEILDYHADVDKLKGSPSEPITSGPRGFVLAAGYQTGDCVVWDLDAKLQILKIHSDVAAGDGELAHGILAIGGCEDMLWIHVRNYGLKMYRWISAKELLLEAELYVDHYGFCGVVSLRCNIAGCGLRYLFGVPCPSDANSPSDVSEATIYTLDCNMDATSASIVSEHFCDKSTIPDNNAFRIYSKCSFNRNHNAKQTKFGMPMKMLLAPVAEDILLFVSYESGHLISWRLPNKVGEVSQIMEVLNVCSPEPVIAFGLDLIRGIGVAVGGDAKIKFLNCKYLKRNDGTEMFEDLLADELDMLECSKILAIDENKFLPLGDSVQSISSLAVRFDGKIGACGLKNGSIVVFSLKCPRLLAVLQFHTSPIVQVTFVPRIVNDKRFLLAACRGGKISIWSIF